MFDSDTSSSGNDSEIDLEKILMQNEKDKEHQNKLKSTESTAVSSILDKILTSFMDEKKLPMTFLTKPCLSEIENTRDSIIPPARQQIESQISTMDAKDTIKNDFLSIARLE
ncbi:MAG: Carboxylesterase 5A, partial [Marteilia pararefringens]